MSIPLSEITAALDKIGGQTHNAFDADYFNTHRRRFELTARRITEEAPRGARILDVGSHYLHMAGTLRLLGYEVVALDVPVFHELPFVRERAEALGITPAPMQRIEEGDFLPDEESAFDLVVFCEIMEHITFNPCKFWGAIHRLLKPGGKIFITTPNSLQLMSVFSVLRRILTFEGVGIDVPTIFNTVTYGHHWKEYSRREIREYFALLSPDFEVKVASFLWRRYRYSAANPKDWLRRTIRWAGNRSGVFAEELEAVVSLRNKTGLAVAAPSFG
ncbi:MAG: hypothetical protein JWL79_3891 [Frankiales bacterium]|nr:hypothetical protein [Frankiales bacterium]